MLWIIKTKCWPRIEDFSNTIKDKPNFPQQVFIPSPYKTNTPQQHIRNTMIKKPEKKYNGKPLLRLTFVIILVMRWPFHFYNVLVYIHTMYSYSVLTYNSPTFSEHLVIFLGTIQHWSIRNWFQLKNSNNMYKLLMKLSSLGNVI